MPEASPQHPYSYSLNHIQTNREMETGNICISPESSMRTRLDQIYEIVPQYKIVQTAVGSLSWNSVHNFAGTKWTQNRHRNEEAEILSNWCEGCFPLFSQTWQVLSNEIWHITAADRDLNTLQRCTGILAMIPDSCVHRLFDRVQRNYLKKNNKRLNVDIQAWDLMKGNQRTKL